MIITTTIDIEVPDNTTQQEVDEGIKAILKDQLFNIWKVSDVERVGFQGAADLLSEISHRKYSRQGVRQLWTRRDYNGFPEQQTRQVKDKEEKYFDAEEVRNWWNSRYAYRT